MAQITMKTNEPEKAAQVLKEILEAETSRIKYSLSIAKSKLKKFENKYKVTSEIFRKEWSAEYLDGKHMEYIKWAGEYKLFLKMNERLLILRNIKDVTP